MSKNEPFKLSISKTDQEVLDDMDSPSVVLTVRSTKRGNLKFKMLVDLVTKKLSEELDKQRQENNVTSIQYRKLGKITQGDVLEEAVDLLLEKYNNLEG